MSPAAPAAPVPVRAAPRGADGNIAAGLDLAGTPADFPSANDTTATGGSGGNGSAGLTGGNGTEAKVLAANTQNLDGEIAIGANGANNP